MSSADASKSTLDHLRNQRSRCHQTSLHADRPNCVFPTQAVNNQTLHDHAGPL
ncbi:Uncharacterised protein [Vibrio cholerae]|nr:Uncharacterised protein [Vibrio cholerae]